MKIQEYYEFTIVSRKNGCQTRLPPALRHKDKFTYECLLERAITRHCMHGHAMLFFFKVRQLSTTEERMIRWFHRLDV
jgi:hypothetical protein